MFERNDKSLKLVRKIVNVVLFVLMCVSVIVGIALISSAFNTTGKIVNFVTLIIGICTMILGPIILQLVWLNYDIKFNALLDLKIIRNAQFHLPAGELKAPLFFDKIKNKGNDIKIADVYEELRKYKSLCDESVITVDEFEQIKGALLNKNAEKECSIDEDIAMVKRLKSYVDDNIITEEEFAKEKSKILKK